MEGRCDSNQEVFVVRERTKVEKGERQNLNERSHGEGWFVSTTTREWTEYEK